MTFHLIQQQSGFIQMFNHSFKISSSVYEHQSIFYVHRNEISAIFWIQAVNGTLQGRFATQTASHKTQIGLERTVLLRIGVYLDLPASCCQIKREKYFALPSRLNRLSIRGSGKVSALVTELRTRVDAKSHRTVLLSN